MAKKHLLKKGVAYMLSAAMVLTSNGLIPGVVQTASAEDKATPDTKAGLIAYYPFDGTLENTVSGGEAKLHGGAGDTWNKPAVGDATYGTGKKGQAFDFNGGANNTEGNNGLELDTKITTDSYTISFWAQMDKYVQYTSLVFANGTDGGFNLAENWGGDTFPTLRSWKDGQDNKPEWETYVDAWTAPSTGTWTYITLTYTNGTLCLYRNGRLAGQKDNAEHTLATIKNQLLFLGINWWDATIDGRIDNFALYDRALSADDVLALYIEENGGIIYDITSGLEAYYPFDGNLDNIVSKSGGKAKLHGGAGDTWNKPAVGVATYGKGKKGQAFDFNGGANNTEGNNGLELDAKVTGNSYTISFWAQMDKYEKYTSLVFANGTDGGFNLAENWGGDTFPTLRSWKDGQDNKPEWETYVDAWTAPSTGTWTYITLTYINGTLCLYRNGELFRDNGGLDGAERIGKVDNAEHTLATIKNQLLYLGINWWDATIDGRIDNFALYNRALSPEDVAALYEEENASTEGLTLDITAEENKTVITNRKYSEDNYDLGSLQLSAAIASQSLPMQCEWTVNDGAHATVDETGLVKLTKDATDGEEITVTATNSYGVTGTIELSVEVKNIEVTVESIKLNTETSTIEKGDTLPLVATVLPENATEKGVMWSSSDEGVATVSADGIVTAVAEGVATIKATSKENADIFESCTVTVTESSAPDNTGGPVNDESKLGTYRSDLAYRRVGVHDPSIVQDPETKKYYLFGSHCAWAWSDDLENWTPFTNNITEDVGDKKGSAHTIFKDEIEWCKKKDPNYNVTGNLWAPDVIWDDEYVNADGSKGAWLMYMSINGPDWNSTISLLTSDSLDGNWTYVGPVIQSGMSKGYGVTFDYEKVTGGTDISRYTDSVSNRGNPTLEAHAIDPCVLYDDNDGFWMSYGSWSGGISMIKLDKKTGLRDYNTTYADTNNAPGTDGLITDPYTGYKIAGGTAVSGEGSYIEKIGDYYFLFLSYGGYAPDGGYNMRIFRSNDIKGPYKDVSDKDARTVVNTSAGNTTGTTGMRLMSYYKWSFADYGYTAQGHNSATVGEDGKAYVIYHNKYNDGTAAHEVRVHQLLTNEDGWILAAPFEYAGETVSKTGYSQKAFTGDYGIMLQKQNINHAKLECQAEQRITLEEGTATGTGYTGNITGDYTGTWTSKTGSPYVSLKIGNTTYKGVFCEGTIDETDIETMTFTAVGDNNQECLWGYKAKDPTVAIRMTIDKVIKIPDTVATDIPLPAMGAGGSTITWKSNNIAIADDGTIPHLFNEDVKASMTATITNNGYVYEHVYEFIVLGNDRLSKGDNVTIKEFYKENPLDMSKLVQGATPKFANPFYYTHEDISGGVSISFDVTRTAISDRLSNIISFNNKLGKLYFTGGSYLGYNDFNGRFMDANLKPGYVQGEDYLVDNTKTNIKIEINQDGFTVYQNDKAVYSSSDVKSTKVPGGFSDNNPEKSILSWIKTAPELNFGSGNFWADLIFKGEISNVVCAYKQSVVDVDNGGSSLSGIYTQDYESVSDISTEWQSPNAQGNISLGKEEGHGKYMSYDFTGETGTNSRGAHSYFGEGITWPDKYILDFDMALKAGNDQESQFAVLTASGEYEKDSNNRENENNGINTGYVFKMSAKNSTTWTINGDTTKTAIIPNSEWAHFTLTGTKGNTAAHLKITNGGNTLFDDDVTATDTENIKGMYILAGRYQPVFKVDNISVKEPSTDVADHTAYDKLMNRIKQYDAVKAIYTDESYAALTSAVTAAKEEVTSTVLQDVIDRHVAAIKAAINGLVRKVCTVTVTEAANGTVTGLAAEGKYMAGDSMVLKAVPSEGYDLDCWKNGEDVISYSRKYSAMVMEDITLTPVFKTADELVPTPPPSSSQEPVVTPEPSSSLLPGGSTPTPKPSGNNPGGGIGGYVPSISSVPASTPAPVNTKAPEASQKPVASPTPEASKAPEASATPAPGTDIKVDEETGAVTETTTKVDGNKTTVIEKVTTPDGVENTKETVTEKFDGLTVKTETFTNSETASVLVTTVKSDAAGKVIDASAVVYTGLSDRNSNYSSKTAIPESYMQNVKEAGIDNIDIYVEKPTVDAVKNNLGRKMVIKISVPNVEGVSVKNVIVTKESIDSAKEGIRKLVVKIESDKPSDCYTITIPQSELKKMDSKINVAVKTGKVSSMDSSNSKKVNKILTSNKLGKDNSYVVTIASNDTKGGIKVTTPAMLPSVKEGDKVYAYSYNKKTGKLEEIPNSKRTVIEGGEAAIEGFSGNTYVITDKELSGKNVVTLLDKAKVSVGKTSFKPGNKTKVKVNLGNGLVSKPNVNSSAPYAKQAAVVTYKSSSKKVKVSKDGTVTAKGKGKATITIKIKLAGGKVKTVKKNVTVK